MADETEEANVYEELAEGDPEEKAVAAILAALDYVQNLAAACEVEKQSLRTQIRELEARNRRTQAVADAWQSSAVAWTKAADCFAQAEERPTREQAKLFSDATRASLYAHELQSSERLSSRPTTKPPASKPGDSDG